MWFLVGLGNPGDQYSRNRHNIGFMVIDAIAEKYAFPPFRAKFQGLLSEGRIAGQKVALFKPQTYMNNSGQAVKAAEKFFKLETGRIVVFHDELDLPPGKVRTKQGGGHAGHNGLRSLDAHLGTPDYWRVRMGIGHPGDRGRVHGYVLKDFAKAEEGWLRDLLDACAAHVDFVLKDDMNGFMSKVALAVRPVDEAARKPAGK